MIQSWTDITVAALQKLWQGFLEFFPNLLGALIVFIIGWFLAIGVGKLVTEILKRIKFNKLFEKGAWKAALEKADFKVDAAGFFGALCKWILVIVFLLAAVEILGFIQFAGFLRDILNYLPNVIVASLIFIVTVILVDILEKVVRASIESAKIGYGRVVSLIIKWAVWAFAFLAILHQLGIARYFVDTLFTGAIAMLVIAFGIALGLGGKDVAAEFLRDLKDKFRE